MQTFLPYPGFIDSARVLDQRRLGKQRVETIQVLRALTVPNYGWRHHPAVAMWAGYEEGLVRYGLDVCDAWVATGRADTCATTLVTDLADATGVTEVRSQDELAAAGELPPWLGDPAFHLSHQAALVRKDPELYRPLFPDAPDDIPYLWPASDRERRIPVDAAGD
ncbi:MSMEG_6728 family protein [Mycobacterium sp. MYCO198283]|uniref:MSMEG_6728 family protein n=1 Tax=Mycobacterium sp. MYCO198283 TaxID=2883505 RepID=UPI001E2EEFE2|nr:MSMEG_6728 family protein [Mycobacterium sp. MYCO198283]MCG5433263.1 MSMEG_6728 family protein [Mycobacterium sp. MYCO198283]